MEKIKNSIEGLEQGTFAGKLAYALLLVLGILFFVASLSTVYSMYSQFQVSGSIAEINDRKIALFGLYVALNFMVGYGLVFCKRWIVSLFGLNALLMGCAFLYGHFIALNQSMASSSASAFLVSFVMMAITYLLRKFLNDSPGGKRVEACYAALLLITFAVTYLI